MELVAFQNIFICRKIRLLIVYVHWGDLERVYLSLGKVSIQVWLSLSIGLLSAVSFYHHLPFLNVVKANGAARIFYLFVISQKFLVCCSIQLSRFRVEFSLRVFLWALNHDVEMTDANRRVGGSKYLSIFTLLSLDGVEWVLTYDWLFIFQDFLFERSLQYIFSVWLKSFYFLMISFKIFGPQVSHQDLSGYCYLLQGVHVVVNLLFVLVVVLWIILHGWRVPVDVIGDLNLLVRIVVVNSSILQVLSLISSSIPPREQLCSINVDVVLQKYGLDQDCENFGAQDRKCCLFEGF